MKLFVATIFSMFALPAIAADVVAERATCADIQSQITELSGVVDADENVLAELVDLKSEYRRSCSRNAGARRTSADARGSVVAEEVMTEEEGAAPVEVVVAETVAEDAEPTLKVEQELANLDAGLCADGSAPNKFGCCGDEVFKDLGDTVFACCPRGGGADAECFPPIK